MPRVVVLAGAPPSWHQSLVGGCLSLGPSAVASHRSAAKLWELDGAADDVIEISVASKAKRDGIVVHRLAKPPPHVSQRDGIPVTDPTCTILDLAAVVGGYPLEKALDSAVRLGLTHHELLVERLEQRARSGRNGIRAMRRLLEARGPAPRSHESALEVKFSRFVRAFGLPSPTPQFVIEDDEGRFLARVDFAYSNEQVAIELQSYAHHHERGQWEKDQERSSALSSINWLMVPVTNLQLSQAPKDLADRLERILSLRGGH